MIAAVGCLVIALACQDVDRTLGPAKAPPKATVAASPPVLLSLTCTLELSSTTISCKPEMRSPAAAMSASVIYDSTAGYAVFFPYNLVKDTVAHTWAFTAHVQNLLKQSIGTLNGTTVTGVKAFVTDLHATSSTGSVSVANADGSGNFTAPNQPYFNYNQFVAPSGYSGNKLWKFNVPNAVTAVSMSILISTDFPAEQSVAITPPSLRPLWFDTLSAGGFVPRVVTVIFQSFATLADRQLAVAFVGGTLIGGTPLSMGEGFYHLSIPDSGQGVQIDSAIARLSRLPQVAVASRLPLLTGQQVNPSDRTTLRQQPPSIDSLGTKNNLAFEQISPPDTEPSWFSADSNWNGSQMKRVISLVFKSGTTLADRQLAIAYVGGTIVGGVQGDDGEGGYLVSIASDGSVSALTAAINRLSSLPQVDFAVETARGAPNSLESVHGAKRTSRPHSPAFVSDSDPNRDSSRASSTARLAASPPVLLSLTCMLARASTVISCQPARPRSAAGVRASVIQGDTAAYASFLSHGFVKDTVARTWTFAANVRNLLEQSIGTLNGTTVTGVKVIVTDVRATAGKGTVSVANADGIGNFTVPNQPHFNYNQVVAPSGYSVNKLWKLNVPNTVTSVCMSILISTHFPAEQNVTALPPATRPAWFNDDSSWTGPQHDDFLKRVITLWFREGTTLQDRQLAIAYVNGTVVGGEPLSSGDGVYYVKVGDDGSGTQLGVAISRLKRLPQVEVAALTSAGSPGS